MNSDQKEYQRRRKRLMDLMNTGAIAILPSAPVRVRNRDVEYPYRPDSDFYYLTGFPEPEAVAVLIPDRPQGEYVLFCRERDPQREQWDGYRAGLEGACEIYGADDAFPFDDLDDILPGLLENRERIFYTMGMDAAFDQRVVKWLNLVRERVRTGVTAPAEFVSLQHYLHEMRLYKSAAEIKLMRQAASISAGAHERAMRACQPGMTEYQLEAELTHEFMRHGARAPAYPSIVGGGANGCILHYIENSATLADGDLVLIDAGCEYGCYASDITRTFPINGHYSDAQREVYNIVLEAQAAAIKKVKPGNHWNDPHEAAVKVLTKGLVELGILEGKVTELVKQQAYSPYYMHRTGHWLGMDVHDVGDYKVDSQWRLLEPGMVMTVEPGLYLKADIPGLPRRWHNIGIRIEDDVLVTKDGHEVITAAAPKDPDAIESLMAAAQAA
ncbi:Xaa-Pro aminopeptidase [Methylohalomonas lacus]|uniref:Xaa-Pro aminopeptidase n=1 Tax=Methylohalomonas lacus TaxID=398773 RepID=A0AAE3L1H0_9GAMM|nr:Xaa-Pro aminopeptidase [Methylohalomonas lacus]MCS3904014.1 Xaa-Pro aminopeptidase [Methylohalomonas lacus]